MKKIGLLIALILFLWMGSVEATSFTDIQDTPYEEAVSFLASYGIVSGFPDGTFRPDAPVTRGQVAKIITYMMGYGDFAKELQSTFPDVVNHWASPYVDIAHTFDIVQGYFDGTFRPDNFIDYSEAVTMIVRTLGYSDSTLRGMWPTNYFIKAEDLGLIKDIPIRGDITTRGDLAIMAYRALFLEHGRINASTGLWESNGKPLLSHLGTWEDRFIDQKLLQQYPQASWLKPWLFHQGTLFFDNNQTPVHFKPEDYKILEGKVISTLDSALVIEDPFGNRSIVSITGTPMLLNQGPATKNDLIEGQLTVIYNPSSNGLIRAQGIIARKVTRIFQATSVYTEGITYANMPLPQINGNVDMSRIRVTGATNSLQGIRPNDVLYVYQTIQRTNPDFLEIHVVRSSVIGSMTQTGTNNASGFSVINGRRYNHSDIYQPVTPFDPGYQVTAYLDALGQVVRYQIIRDLQQPEDYGLITALNTSTQEGMMSIQLLNNAGQLRTFTIAADTVRQLSLASGQVIKYNIREETRISNVVRVTLTAYDGSFNATTNRLVGINAGLNNSTLVFYRDSSGWSKISLDQVGEFIKGRVVLNPTKDYVEVLLLEEGIKVSRPNVLFGVVRDHVMVLDSNGDRVHRWTVWIDGQRDFLYSSATHTETLIKVNDHKDQLIRFNLSQDRVTGFAIPRAELDFNVIERLYDRDLFRIQGTFYEHSRPITVYIGEKTDTGYRILSVGQRSDIKEGDRIQLYDLYGNFDGIIDTVIVIPK